MTGVAIWAIWGGNMFPATEDPKGAPETWTCEELRRWLAAVGAHVQGLAVGWMSGNMTQNQTHVHAQQTG